MISEEKLVHVAHIIIDGIYKADIVDYPDDDAALKEAKRVLLHWLNGMNAVDEIARNRIRTQRNAPMEGSPQWENLYSKYCEEELAKRGG